jgi:hypothetical protein
VNAPGTKHACIKTNSVYTIKLSKKSDFQPSTKKSDNIGHPTIEAVQIWPFYMVSKVIIYIFFNFFKNSNEI